MRNVIRLVSKWTGKAAGRTLKTGKQRNLINSDISEYARCYWLATVLLPPQVLSAWLLDVSDYTNTTIPLSPQCFLPYYWMAVITPIPPFPSPLSAFCLTTGCQWLHQYHHSPLPSVLSAWLLDVSDYTNTRDDERMTSHFRKLKYTRVELFCDQVILTGMFPAVAPAPNLAPASYPPSTSTVEPGG